MTEKVRQTEVIIYAVCKTYVSSKLNSKYDLQWNNKLKSPINTKTKAKIPQKDFDEKKLKIANEAFLAVRSRTEKQSFVDYFVSSLYPFIKEQEFVQFAKELFDDNKWKEIRALTLLALASQFPLNKTLEETEDSASDAA